MLSELVNQEEVKLINADFYAIIDDLQTRSLLEASQAFSNALQNSNTQMDVWQNQQDQPVLLLKYLFPNLSLLRNLHIILLNQTICKKSPENTIP